MVFLVSLGLVFAMLVLCVSAILYVLNAPVQDLRFPVRHFVLVSLASCLLFLIGV